MILDKKKRIEFFRSLTKDQRKKLILKKMKEKGIEIGSGVSNKTYYNQKQEINELIKITSCFPELREKNKK